MVGVRFYPVSVLRCTLGCPQPRQGRHSLASGASHWKTHNDSQSPGGATDRDGRLWLLRSLNGNEKYACLECMYGPPLCRPSGAPDDLSWRSRGLRPWLNYATAPQLAD